MTLNHLTWLVTLAALVGTVANIKRKRWCFAVWMVTNALWCAYDWHIGACAQAALFAIYTGLAVWGWFAWKE
jgi:nicotinamide riboside transporter PnuC